MVKDAYLRALIGQGQNPRRRKRHSKLDEYRDIIERKYVAGRWHCTRYCIFLSQVPFVFFC